MSFAITIPYAESLAELPGGMPVVFLVMFIIMASLIHLTLTILIRVMQAVMRRTKVTLGDRISKSLKKYIITIAVLTALWLSLESVYPELGIIDGYNTLDIFAILMLIVVGFMLSTIADSFLLWYGLEIRSDKRKVREKDVFPFVRNVVKVAIVLIFLVFVLHRVGLETGALITGLGVGGLAVALALQDTLGNFFAGVHILMDKPFKEEDFIKLESGDEGTVEQIGWRSTRLVTQKGNEIIVPNSKLSNTIVENYSSPSSLSGIYYTVGVDYKEDIDNVEKVMLDALRKAAKKNEFMEEDSGWVFFNKFGDFSLDFMFGYKIKGHINRFSVLKDVNRELFYAFKKKKISIPFPVRVIYNEKKN